MYTYQGLKEDLSYLAYQGVDVGIIGKSTFGLDIPFVHVGSYDGAQSIVTGGIHARENVTSLLVMRQVFRTAFCKNSFEGGIYFVPMVNPDGAVLIEKGAECFGERSHFLKEVNGSNDFSLWKANINGVDLNNNFDARFSLGIGQKKQPSSQGYYGEFPFSEVESQALKDFTIRVKPKLTLSYHALGRELYWYFFQKESLDRDNRIAERINEILKYKKVDNDLDSSGGYKDWCIEYLKIPSLTVEIIAADKLHPLSDDDLDADWEVNKDIPYELAEIASKL